MNSIKAQQLKPCTLAAEKSAEAGAAPWEAGLQHIQRPVLPLPSVLQRTCQVKWGTVTQVLPQRVGSWHELQPQLLPNNRNPHRNDVLAGRIVKTGRHSAVELSSGRKAELYPGDILVGAFGNRYATAQYEGRVPERLDYYHMLSQGAVFGEVMSASYSMSDPTIIEPLGYLSTPDGVVLNLTQHGLAEIPGSPRIPTLLIIGASMDAGKTTTAANLIHGLSLAGWHVNAGKLTGTGCAKDIHKMLDAGARRVLDFTHCGFCSTAETTNEELHSISSTLISHLSQGKPDLLVLEIADGIIQKETQRLVRMLVTEQKVDGAMLAIHDVLSAGSGADIVERQFKLPLLGISGAVTQSPLSTAELRSVTNIPVYDMPALADPIIALALEPLLERAAKVKNVQWHSIAAG